MRAKNRRDQSARCKCCGDIDMRASCAVMPRRAYACCGSLRHSNDRNFVDVLGRFRARFVIIAVVIIVIISTIAQAGLGPGRTTTGPNANAANFSDQLWASTYGRLVSVGAARQVKVDRPTREIRADGPRPRSANVSRNFKLFVHGKLCDGDHSQFFRFVQAALTKRFSASSAG